MPPKLKPLSEQVIVITGASSGIGLATARLAAQAGAKVVLAARDGQALARICADIQHQGGTAHLVAADVSIEADIDRIAARALEHHGDFDTWVNAAGVGLSGALKDIATEDHRRLFDINYWGIVYGSLAAARHFRARGKPGAIINLGSTVSDVATPLSAPYAASKFAIKGFTDALRIELMQEDLPVSVTLIKPAAIDTRFFDHSKSLLGAAAYAPPPRYTPDVVAKAILHAARHRKRAIAVGSPAIVGGLAAWLMPGLTDRLLSITKPTGLADRTRPAPAINSLNDVPAEGRERSGHYAARSFSLTTEAQLRPRMTLALIVALATATGLAMPAVRRRIGLAQG